MESKLFKVFMSFTNLSLFMLIVFCLQVYKCYIFDISEECGNQYQFNEKENMEETANCMSTQLFAADWDYFLFYSLTGSLNSQSLLH